MFSIIISWKILVTSVGGREWSQIFLKERKISMIKNDMQENFEFVSSHLLI